jgi:outer membrane murein-binding lipoprotein Lpp
LRHVLLSTLGLDINISQELAASVEQLTQQRDAAKSELDMARDTARTYYQKMLQAESDASRMKISMVAT